MKLILAPSFIDSNKAKRRYDVPVLSGSAFIGQLYDAKRNEIIYDKFLWEEPIAMNEAEITSVETYANIEHNIRDRMHNMKISAHLKLDLAFIEVIFGEPFFGKGVKGVKKCLDVLFSNIVVLKDSKWPKI